MTQEEKDLLLKDISARLPYGVKGAFYLYGIDKWKTTTIRSINPSEGTYRIGNQDYDEWERIKPYLRPLSSMTDEEEKELSKRYVYSICGNRIRAHYHSEGYWDDDTELCSDGWEDLFNWLNSHHFDFRGLIEKGLAIEDLNYVK